MISVIVNVYNCEKYLKKCIDSIINQTYKDLEILIINDGSTDNTSKMLKKYKDNRIRIINQDNMGITLARNVGLDNATGEYIYFVDGDDYIKEDTIEYLYNLCIKYNKKMAFCNYFKFNDYDFKYENKKEKIEILSCKDMLKRIVIPKNMEPVMWNKLVKRELYDNLRFEDRIINDMAFTYKLVMKTDSIIYSNQIKYYYYNNIESISRKKASTERLIDIYEVFYNRYKYIKEKYDFVDNEASLLWKIIELYLKDNNDLRKYLDDNNVYDVFKKVFTFKVVFSSLKFKEKISIILFRISPKLNNVFAKLYLKTKKVSK